MRIYLDDDIRDHTLIAFLTKDGHDVHLPPDSYVGRHDAVHFLDAIKEQRAILTRNYRDYDALHPLILGCGGHHFGILEVRADNNRIRDMSPKEMATVISKIEQYGVDVSDQLVVLNAWR